MPTLEITTKLGCVLACRFCPQDRLVKSYPPDEPRLLTLAAFRAVEAKLPPQVRLDFSGMAEPWLNPDATEMVLHAFAQGRKVAIYSTLQGMPPADAATLIGRFADRISVETPWVIHLPDADGHMTGWRPTSDYLATLGRFVALQRDRAPAGFGFMTMSRDGAVHPALRPVIDVALDRFIGVSRAENLDRGDFAPGALLRQMRHRGALLCGSTPFFDHNVMLPNGDVLLCCMDYGRRHVLGNLLRQDYADLFSGTVMGSVRARAMGVDDGALLCRDCHHAVCLDQQGGTHWRPQRAAEWTTPPPAVAVSPTPAAASLPTSPAANPPTSPAANPPTPPTATSSTIGRRRGAYALLRRAAGL